MIESASEIFEIFEVENHQLYDKNKYYSVHENINVDNYPSLELKADDSKENVRKYELLSENFVAKMEDEYWGRSEFNDRITNLIRECNESTINTFKEYCHINFISKAEFEEYATLMNSTEVRCNILEQNDKQILQNQSKLKLSIHRAESAISVIEKKLLNLQETQSMLQLVNGLTKSFTDNDQKSSNKNRHFSHRRNSSNTKMSVDHELSIINYDIQSMKREVELLQLSTKEIRSILPQLQNDITSFPNNKYDTQREINYFNNGRSSQSANASLTNNSKYYSNSMNDDGKINPYDRSSREKTSPISNDNNNIISDSYRTSSALYDGVLDPRNDQNEDRLSNYYHSTNENQLEDTSDNSQSNYFKHYGTDDRYVLADNLLEYGPYFQDQNQDRDQDRELQRPKSTSPLHPTYQRSNYQNNEDSNDDIPFTTTANTTSNTTTRNKANRPFTSLPSGRNRGNSAYRNRRMHTSNASTTSRPAVSLREVGAVWSHTEDEVSGRENPVIQHKEHLQRFLHDDHYFSSKIKESIEADEQDYLLLHGGQLTQKDKDRTVVTGSVNGTIGSSTGCAAPVNHPVSDTRDERTGVTYAHDAAWEWNLKFGATTATTTPATAMPADSAQSHHGMRGYRVKSGGGGGGARNGATGRMMFRHPATSSQQQMMMDRYRQRKAQIIKDREKEREREKENEFQKAVSVAHPTGSGDTRVISAAIPPKASPGNNNDHTRRMNDTGNTSTGLMNIKKSNEQAATTKATPRSNVKGSVGNGANSGVGVGVGSEGRHQAHLTAVDEVMKNLQLTATATNTTATAAASAPGGGSTGNQSSSYPIREYNADNPPATSIADGYGLTSGTVAGEGGGTSEIKNGRLRQKSAFPRETLVQDKNTLSKNFGGAKSPRPPTAPSRMQRGSNNVA